MDVIMNDRWKECIPGWGQSPASPQLLPSPDLHHGSCFPNCLLSYVNCIENVTIIRADTTTSN